MAQSNRSTPDGDGSENRRAGGSDNLDDGGTALIDPATIGASSGGDGGDTTTPRRRGRPPGAGRGKRGGAKETSLDLSAFTGSLVLVHQTLANLAHIEELAISEDEASAICVAAGNVARHYDMSFLSQKALDWTALVNVLAMVYGSRLIVIRAKHSQAKRQTVEMSAGVVSDPAFDPHPGFIDPGVIGGRA